MKSKKLIKRSGNCGGLCVSNKYLTLVTMPKGRYIVYILKSYVGFFHKYHTYQVKVLCRLLLWLLEDCCQYLFYKF